MPYLPGALQFSKGGKAHESAAGEVPAGKSMHPSQGAWGSKEGSNQGGSAAVPKSSRAVPAANIERFLVAVSRSACVQILHDPK